MQGSILQVSQPVTSVPAQGMHPITNIILLLGLASPYQPRSSTFPRGHCLSLPLVGIPNFDLFSPTVFLQARHWAAQSYCLPSKLSSLQATPASCSCCFSLLWVSGSSQLPLPDSLTVTYQFSDAPSLLPSITQVSSFKFSWNELMNHKCTGLFPHKGSVLLYDRCIRTYLVYKERRKDTMRKGWSLVTVHSIRNTCLNVMLPVHLQKVSKNVLNIPIGGAGSNTCN